MTEPVPADHLRFLPPALRTEAEAAQAAAASPDVLGVAESAADDSGHSRAWRFFHARAWKLAIGWLSLLLIMLLFGMMCSPAYWRF